jgi:phosphate starvation-inducible PhoH-like protein
MARTKKQTPTAPKTKERSSGRDRSFHLEFKNIAQKMAWTTFQQHDIMFLMGPAGTGKTYLATAFAINEVLAKRASRIIMTRPIVEAGESLGYLPGTFDEKVYPYMLPIYDCIQKLVGKEGMQYEMVKDAMEVAPLAYMRGRTFDDAICIFDESQNATYSQLKLFVTRLGENSKMIITGDPNQSDLPPHQQGFTEFCDRIVDVEGVGMVSFKNDSIVRHPILSKILERL